MKNSHRLWVLPFIALAIGGWTWHNQSVAAPSTQTVIWKNGVAVSILPVEQTDLGRLFDASISKFHVILPQGGHNLKCSLILKRRNHPDEVVGGFQVSTPFSEQDKKDFDVTLALRPLGESWDKSPKFKYVAIGGGTGGVAPNPLHAAHSLIRTGATLSFLREGIVLLMSESGKTGSSQLPEEDADGVLYCQFAPAPSSWQVVKNRQNKLRSKQ